VLPETLATTVTVSPAAMLLMFALLPTAVLLSIVYVYL
jgi:hypothetical protein